MSERKRDPAELELADLWPTERAAPRPLLSAPGTEAMAAMAWECRGGPGAPKPRGSPRLAKRLDPHSGADAERNSIDDGNCIHVNVCDTIIEQYREVIRGATDGEMDMES